MEMKKILSIIAGAALILGSSSCSGLLDIDQHGVLNYDTYYNTDEEAETAVTSIYGTLRGLEYNIKLLKNLLSDEFWAGGANRGDNSDLEAINEYTFNSDHEFLQGVFESYYQVIYKANVVLGHVLDDTPVKQQMRAEAKVFRAMAYFDLITMWGNPPLVDHELSDKEYHQPNGKTEELWGLVERDLNEAIASGTLAEKSGINDQTVWRVTKQYAQALLGKALIWQKKYTEAAAALEEVITSQKYDLYRGAYEDVISSRAKMNCESLFESIKVYDKDNAFDNYSMYGVMINYRSDRLEEGCMQSVGLAPTGWGFCVPQERLYNAFVAEEGQNGIRLGGTIKTYDQMKDLGIKMKAGETIINDGYFFWKWRVYDEELPPEGYGMFVYTNNMRWMRYAEVLLLAAEANLLAGNQIKADTYLNLVRDRAGLSPKTATLEAIQTEKQLELCGECVRYQDMIRWEIAEDLLKDQGEYCPVMNSNGVVTKTPYNTDSARYGFKAKHKLLPYPAVEHRLNNNIQPNPGW